LEIDQVDDAGKLERWVVAFARAFTRPAGVHEATFEVELVFGLERDQGAACCLVDPVLGSRGSGCLRGRDRTRGPPARDWHGHDSGAVAESSRTGIPDSYIARVPNGAGIVSAPRVQAILRSRSLRIDWRFTVRFLSPHISLTSPSAGEMANPVGTW
jgi:hypothetical protein